MGESQTESNTVPLPKNHRQAGSGNLAEFSMYFYFRISRHPKPRAHWQDATASCFMPISREMMHI